MQRISLRAIFCVLLLVTLLFPVHLVNKAFAQSDITIGFAVDGSGLIISSETGEEVGLYLEKQLSIPVRVRSFTTESYLYDWLVRYREVDFAWLSQSFQDQELEGEFYPLVENLDHSYDLFKGNFVARQGQKSTLLQQVSAVFLSMHKNPEGRALLKKLGVSRFVSTSLWQTPVWIGATQVQPDQATTPREKDRMSLSGQDEVTGSELTTAPFSADEMKIEEQAAEKDESSVSKRESASLNDEGPIVDEDLQERSELAPISPLATIPESSLAEMVVSQPVTADPQDVPVIDKPSTSVDDSLSLAGNENVKTEAATEPVPETEQESPIALVADSLTYDSDEDSYEAKGDVVLRQGEVELKSETLLWQAATQDASAEGAVELDDLDTKVLGSSIQYNMATRQGQIRDGRLFVREGNFHLTGQQIEKEGQFEYSVKDGSFTTCDGEIPDWKFSANEVDITVGGYARAKHVWFHVKDVPVLYAPYLSFPVKAERESGLLTPSFGYSNNKGTRASMAWYQVIDRNMDATIYLDYLSEIGLGKGLEYRYALTGNNNGNALYYHVTGLGDLEESGQNEDFPDLDYYKWEHKGILPGDWRLMADIEYTDEKLFFEEFGEVAEDYNRDKTVSTLMLSRNWQKLNLVGHARYIKDLESNNNTTLQRLPELGLGLSRYRLGDTSLYAGLESYATRFWREEGEDGERLYLVPSLSASLKPGSWLEIVPEVALHERLYNSDAEEDEKFIPEFSITTATRLLKTFELNRWGIDTVQHSVEPKVAYTYVPDEDQEKLPLFDLSDRIQDRNDITYALVNRLTARSTAADGSRTYRELLNLRLSQSYNFDEPENSRTGKDEPFSDVRVELDFWPSQYFSLSLDSLIPVYGDTSLRSLSAGLSANDGTGNSVSVNYTYSDAERTNASTDYIDLRFSTPVLRPVYLLFEERYDFKQESELEKVVGLEYRSKCWSLFLTYKNRYRDVGDDDQEIMFSFVLSGLGKNGGFGM